MQFSTYANVLSQQGRTSGEARKHNSDMILEKTWNNDLQSRICYIYDYEHDITEWDKNYDLHPYKDKYKTRIDAKYIVTQYSTLAKDEVEYHLLFRPSQKSIEYSCQEYGAEFPVGLYVDVPDSNGIYRRWMICSRDHEQQFIKFSIVPCNYHFHWIENENGQYIKRKMWGIARMRNSYNAGVWRDYIFQKAENQDQMWLPMNSVSNKIYYDDRIVVSTKMENPITWIVTKLENIHPLGINKITLGQSKFNPITDRVFGGFEMYADYTELAVTPDKENTVVLEDFCKVQYSGTDFKLRIGGSKKTLTAKFYNKENVEIDAYTPSWEFYIDGNDAIEYLELSPNDYAHSPTIIVSLKKDYTLIGKILKVICKDTDGLVEDVINLELCGL